MIKNDKIGITKYIISFVMLLPVKFNNTSDIIIKKIPIKNTLILNEKYPCVFLDFNNIKDEIKLNRVI